MTRSTRCWAARLCMALGAVFPMRADAQPSLGAENDSSAAIEPAAWSLRLSAGFGIGSRDFDLPMDGVIYQTRTGIFPAADLGFALDHRASDEISVGLLVRYQSSINLGIVERHTDGSEHPQGIRSHRLELAIAPSFRLDAKGRWALLTSIGYGICDLRPEAHLVTPAYSLGGPHLRAELQLPVWGDRVRLRLGPEAGWIVHVGQELVDRGVATRGLGVGGAAALELVLGPRWIVDATYWEFRTWLNSSQAGSFEDVVRFVTARLSGTL